MDEAEYQVGRTAPHNQEAERAVVGALLIDPLRVPEAAEHLKPDDFFGKRYGIVYEALDTKLDRTVALKLLPAAALGSEDDRIKRFGHDQVSTFGIGQELDARGWRGLYRALIAQGSADSFLAWAISLSSPSFASSTMWPTSVMFITWRTS